MSNIGILKINQCTGCATCAQSCPTNSIEMQFNKEGFLFPHISTSCINCGKCVNNCPILSNAIKDGNRPKKGYIAVAKDKRTAFLSASGGGFILIARWIIENKQGVVFGCVMDEDLHVFHTLTEESTGLIAMQGSKYVQSDMRKTYIEAKQFLNDGRYVLFSGTPCQIAGLRCFLNQPFTNLYTIDVVCHGVPSPVVFSKYIDWLEKKKNEKIKSYKFRNKTGYDNCGFIAKIDYQNSQIQYKNAMRDPYYRSFLNGLCFRQSCYSCPFAQPNRISDITIGDLGTRKLYPDFHPEEAISCILINTEHGMSLWDANKNKFDQQEIDLEKEIRKNGQLNHPFEYKEEREKRSNMLYSGKFSEVEKEISKNDSLPLKIKEYIKENIPYKSRRKIVNLFRKLF